MLLPSEFPREVEAIACDLDRTLLPESLDLGERTLTAIRRAREAGIHVIVVTGRMFRSVRPYLAAAGLDDPVVCYQGAVVAEPRSGRFLRHVPIPLALARETIAAVEAEGFRLNCYVGDELFVSEVTPEAERYARFQNLEINAVGPLLDWLDEPPTKLVSVDDETRLDGLETSMKGLFDRRLYISKSLPYFLEFAAPEVTKATGLQFLADRMGFSAGRTVAFGDGENDIELLEWAEYGVAVADANPKLHAVADWTCPTAAEEGVAQVIEALLSRSP